MDDIVAGDRGIWRIALFLCLGFEYVDHATHEASRRSNLDSLSLQLLCDVCNMW